MHMLTSTALPGRGTYGQHRWVRMLGHECARAAARTVSHASSSAIACLHNGGAAPLEHDRLADGSTRHTHTHISGAENLTPTDRRFDQDRHRRGQGRTLSPRGGRDMKGGKGESSTRGALRAAVTRKGRARAQIMPRSSAARSPRAPKTAAGRSLAARPETNTVTVRAAREPRRRHPHSAARLLLVTLLGGLQQARRPLRVRAGAAAARLAAGVAPARVDRRDRRAER